MRTKSNLVDALFLIAVGRQLSETVTLARLRLAVDADAVDGKAFPLGPCTPLMGTITPIQNKATPAA